MLHRDLLCRLALGLVLVPVLIRVPGMAPALQAADDTGWNTRFDEGGIQVATRLPAESDYRAFRARVFIEASPDAVLARLRDVDSYPDWFPDTLESRRLELGDGRRGNYVRTDAPWPVKDRDAIYTQSMQRDDHRIRIEVGVAPDALPERDDAVRVRKASGSWELIPLEGGTEVHWEFHLEPGGRVPSGLANARVVDTPRKALEALREYFSR